MEIPDLSDMEMVQVSSEELEGILSGLRGIQLGLDVEGYLERKVSLNSIIDMDFYSQRIIDFGRRLFKPYVSKE